MTMSNPAPDTAAGTRQGAGNGGALGHLRICDFTGQLAGAGATRWLAAFGAQVIRIEDPVLQGRWDILRGSPPFKDERRGVEAGTGFNNHNVEKLGITLNLRTERARELLADLVRISDVVAENFAAGVMERMGFGYERLRQLRPDVVYVSNCGFGQTGPYRNYKSWGPIAQAVGGLTHSSGLPDLPPAGWGYSYMDHTGAYYMAIAVLMALWHRQRTGEGQWVDVSCTEAAANLHGAPLLDSTVNGRSLRGAGLPHSNRSQAPPMAPHGIYPCAGEDNWVALACRDDADWGAMAETVDAAWASDIRWLSLHGRLEAEDELDSHVAAWTSELTRWEVAERLRGAGVPAEAVTRPAERIDGDASTHEWGLWPMVDHALTGGARVDGLPVHLSHTDWSITQAAPLLGQHNREVMCGLLGVDESELDELAEAGVI
jgi:benzylsuccinate CoA-transferase BbsF subunit